jgi:hypothetical protein
MAWTFVGSGAARAIAGQATTPAPSTTILLPSSLAVGDLLVLQFQTFGNNAIIPQNPTGWTQLALITNGGASNHRHLVCYRQYTSTTTEPTITFTGTGSATDSYAGRIIAFRPGGGFTWAIDVTGTASTNASANNIGPASGITPSTLSGGAQTIVVGSFGKPNDFQGAGGVPAGYTGLLTEATAGNDASCYFIRRIDNPQTATGNLTVTDTAQPGVGASILFSFKEVAVVAAAGRSQAIII